MDAGDPLAPIDPGADLFFAFGNEPALLDMVGTSELVDARLHTRRQLVTITDHLWIGPTTGALAIPLGPPDPPPRPYGKAI